MLHMDGCRTLMWWMCQTTMLWSVWNYSQARRTSSEWRRSTLVGVDHSVKWQRSRRVFQAFQVLRHPSRSARYEGWTLHCYCHGEWVFSLALFIVLDCWAVVGFWSSVESRSPDVWSLSTRLYTNKHINNSNHICIAVAVD